MANGQTEEQDIQSLFSDPQEEEDISTLFDQGGEGEEQDINSLFTMPSGQEEQDFSKAFTPVGQEAQRQKEELNVGLSPDEISPFNFGREAIGNPWKRGAQTAFNAVGQAAEMVADAREGTRNIWAGVLDGVIGDEYAETLSKAVVPDQEVVDYISRTIKDYASSIKARPSNLGKPESVWDYVEPNRMYQTIAEGIPLTASLAALTAVNPAAGMATMAAIEGGDSYEAIKRYEENTGETVDPAIKILTPITIGAVNASLEMFSIKRILKVGRGDPGLKKVLMESVLAGLTEAGTEGMQEFNQAIAEVPYSGVIPNNIGERVIHGAYSGALIGTTLGSSNAILSQARNRNPDDVTIEGWNPVDESYEPTFKINKPGHVLEGETVTLEQLQDVEDLNVPAFQREKLKKEMVDLLPEKFEDSPNATPEMVAEMNLRVLEMVSEQFGYDTVDGFIEDHGIIARKGRIEKGDLLQTVAFHGTRHDFDHFSLDFMGTGEGVQAFGWGLYFTEDKGIAEHSYARRLSNNAFKVGFNGRTFKNGLALEDAIFESLGMEGMNREIETNVANLLYDIVTETADAKNGIDITKANNRLERIKERYREQRRNAEESLALWQERNSNVMELEYQTELDRINTDLSIMEKLNLEDFDLVSDQGIVYKVTLNKGLDTDDYRWLNWRDEISTNDLRDIRRHIRELQEQYEFSQDHIADQYKRVYSRLGQMEAHRNDPGFNNVSGERVYQTIQNEFGAKRTSLLLADAGFSGTKFRADAGRSTSYNFAVFDESIITIESKETLYQLSRDNPSVMSQSDWSKIQTSIQEAVKNAEEQKLAKKHPALMPSALAERMIRIISGDGDTILDPFAGVGGTLIGANKAGRKSIGFDLSKEYRDLFRKRKIDKDNPNPEYKIDNANNIDKLPENSIDALVTSPPYWNVLASKRKDTHGSRPKNYIDKGGDISNIEDFTEFLDTLTEIFRKAKKPLKDGAFMAINVQQLRKGQQFYDLPRHLTNRLEDLGFTLYDHFIWNKKAQARARSWGWSPKAEGGISPMSIPNHESVLIFKNTEVSESQFQRGDGRAKASVNFNDGQTLIKIFQSADASSVLHELAHIFRTYMPEDLLQEANEVFDINEEGWTRAKEEEFARKWEQWFARGRKASEKGANVFSRFRDWLVEIYSRAHATLGGEMSNEQMEFFDNIFDSLEADIAKMPDGQRESVLGHWFEKFMDIWDIEHAGRRMGMPDTFFHLKNRFSVESIYTQEGIEMVTEIPASVRMSTEKSADAVMLAESSETIAEIDAKDASERTDVEQAALTIRDYFDVSQEQYRAKGIEVDFRERLLSELQARLESESLSQGDREAIQNLHGAIADIGDIEFVHIPFNFWFKRAIEKDPSRASRLWLDIEAVARKRETLRIADLIEEGVITKDDISVADIVSSYSKIKGKDFALLNIREAALNEGSAMPRMQGESSVAGFKTPPPNMRVFDGLQLREPLYHWLVDQMSPSPLNRFQQAFNTVKMWAFWNPLFLPMYDIVQSHMAGAMNILRPIQTFKQIKRGFNDQMNWTTDAKIAAANGKDSVPFNSPLEQIGQEMDIASRTRHHSYDGTGKKVVSWSLARGEHMFRDILEKTFDANDSLSFLKQLGGIRPAIRNIYELSWSLAWFLDNSVRQVTNNHFIDQGYSPREAAQMAARAHADYASVPPKTRKALNTIFFTPTFKIAMGKWMLDSIRSIGNVAAGNATISNKQRAAVIARTIAILGAFDMLLLSLGFDRDEWGRRYTRPIDTETGQRELVINWTGPHNLFLKYMQRTKEALGPEVPNPMLRVFQQNSWEITPLLRIATTVITNETPGGEKLWFVGDDTEVKVAKALVYASTSSINILQQLANEDEFGKEGSEAFAREYGQLLETVTAPFVFKYTRQTPDVRMQQKLQMMMRIHEEEVEARNLFTRLMRSGGNPQDVLDQYVEGKGPFKVGATQRSENLVRRMQQLIWDFEAEQWDQWDSDVRDVGVPGGMWDPENEEQSFDGLFNE